jgi:hypothetical protein
MRYAPGNINWISGTPEAFAESFVEANCSPTEPGGPYEAVCSITV